MPARMQPGADLRGVNLLRANLENVNLTEADATWAILTRANLAVPNSSARSYGAPACWRLRYRAPTCEEQISAEPVYGAPIYAKRTSDTRS